MLTCPRRHLAEDQAANQGYMLLQGLWDHWSKLVHRFQLLADLAKRLEQQEAHGKALGNPAITALFIAGERLGSWIDATTKDLHKVAVRHDANRDEATGAGPNWRERSLTEKQLMGIDQLLDMGLEGAELIRDELKRVVRLDKDIKAQIGEEQIQLAGLSTQQSITRLNPLFRMVELAVDRAESDVLDRFDAIAKLKPTWERDGEDWSTNDPAEQEATDQGDESDEVD